MPHEFAIWALGGLGTLAAISAGLALSYRQVALELLADVELLSRENERLRVTGALRPQEAERQPPPPTAVETACRRAAGPTRRHPDPSGCEPARELSTVSERGT